MIAAVEWTGVLVGAAIGAGVSAAVGVVLFYVLPRGVVLTRSVRGPDRWEVRNESALSALINSVRYCGVSTYNAETSTIEEHELSPDQSGPPSLRFDDATAEIAREDWQAPWAGQVVRPGDTLEAHVPGNMTLLIDYQRKGWWGRFEKRHLVIHGHV